MGQSHINNMSIVKHEVPFHQSVLRLVLVSILHLHDLLDINANVCQILFLHSGDLEAEGPRFSLGLTSQVVFEMLPQPRGRREGLLAILTEERLGARMYP